VPKPSHIRTSHHESPSNGQKPASASGGSGVANESVARKSRRRFTAAEKLRIVRAAAACTQRGEVEALLRREGIYSSHLAAWRKQLDLRGTDGLTPRKPGRKAKLDARDRRIVELEKRNTVLERKLHIAEKLIELQKKASALLGVALPDEGES